MIYALQISKLIYNSNIRICNTVAELTLRNIDYKILHNNHISIVFHEIFSQRDIQITFTDP